MSEKEKRPIALIDELHEIHRAMNGAYYQGRHYPSPQLETKFFAVVSISLIVILQELGFTGQKADYHVRL